MSISFKLRLIEKGLLPYNYPTIMEQKNDNHKLMTTIIEVIRLT